MMMCILATNARARIVVTDGKRSSAVRFVVGETKIQIAGIVTRGIFRR